MMREIRFDFRSDTITKPSAGMRQAIAEAEVGDDYYGEDPTVRLLERRMAEAFGKPAAVFTTSGTQSNLMAVMAHCGRGDAYVVGNRSHSYCYEAGGVAAVAGVHPLVTPNQADGSIAVDDIVECLEPEDVLFPRCRLLALENTIGGKVLSVDYMAAAWGVARDHGLACHLDGARAFNAAAALGVAPREIGRHFDTVSICMSKGLGAPAGSVLVGPEAVIAEARRHRQILGGAMRQSGILAAAGVYALDHNVARLVADHERATRLARALNGVAGVNAEMPQTNIIFAAVDPAVADRFAAHLAANGVGYTGTDLMQRWVTHLDVDDERLDGAIGVLAAFGG